MKASVFGRFEIGYIRLWLGPIDQQPTQNFRVRTILEAISKFYLDMLYNYSLLLRSIRVFMGLKNDIHRSL
jgi:hypothetical protein